MWYKMGSLCYCYQTIHEELYGRVARSNIGGNV